MGSFTSLCRSLSQIYEPGVDLSSHYHLNRVYILLLSVCFLQPQRYELIDVIVHSLICTKCKFISTLFILLLAYFFFVFTLSSQNQVYVRSLYSLTVRFMNQVHIFVQSLVSSTCILHSPIWTRCTLLIILPGTWTRCMPVMFRQETVGLSSTMTGWQWTEMLSGRF